MRADELAAEQVRFVAGAVRLERSRIARELHDVVAHCMTVIVVQARAGQQQVDADPAAVPQTLRAISSAAREAAGDIEALVMVMEPRPLSRAILDRLIGRATDAGAAVSITVRGVRSISSRPGLRSRSARCRRH